MAAAAQMNLLTKVTEMCDSVMQRLAHTPGQRETPPREPRPHLTVSFYMGYDDVKSVADFLDELQTYHLASGASEAFIVERIVPLALQASARCWLGSQAPSPAWRTSKQGFKTSSCLQATRRRFSESSRQGRSTRLKVWSGTFGSCKSSSRGRTRSHRSRTE
ncbi:hypothetical protein ISCGN_001521 [Ixodes scapularis]